MFDVGSLVLIHGVHLGVITRYHEKDNIWLVRLMCGLYLGVFYDDIELVKIKEKQYGNDNTRKAKVCPEGG